MLQCLTQKRASISHPQIFWVALCVLCTGSLALVLSSHSKAVGGIEKWFQSTSVRIWGPQALVLQELWAAVGRGEEEGSSALQGL